ncbi:MAG: ThiF family adenylyltransferase [Caulobacteraceae bacterium]
MSFSDEEVERYAPATWCCARSAGRDSRGLKAARVLIVGAGGLARRPRSTGGGGRRRDRPRRCGHRGAVQPAAAGAVHGGRPGAARRWDAAAEHLAALNANVRVTPIADMLTEANARELIRGYDLVLDGTDDFATRFAVNAACVAEGVTLVSGAIGPLDRPGRRVRWPSLLPVPRAGDPARRGDLRRGRRDRGAGWRDRLDDGAEAVKLVAGGRRAADRPAADLRRAGQRRPHGARQRRSALPGLRGSVTDAPLRRCGAGVDRARARWGHTHDPAHSHSARPAPGGRAAGRAGPAEWRFYLHAGLEAGQDDLHRLRQYPDAEPGQRQAGSICSFCWSTPGRRRSSRRPKTDPPTASIADSAAPFALEDFQALIGPKPAAPADADSSAD